MDQGQDNRKGIETFEFYVFDSTRTKEEEKKGHKGTKSFRLPMELFDTLSALDLIIVVSGSPKMGIGWAAAQSSNKDSIDSKTERAGCLTNLKAIRNILLEYRKEERRRKNHGIK